MTHQRPLTVLVNTCDGFEDCWDPFFRLFARYWPQCPYPVVLNTETKAPVFDNLPVRSMRSALGCSRRLTWSECLARCLDAIETPFVLYLQEDYLLEAPVRADLIATLVDELAAGRADVVRLMECDDAGPWTRSPHPLLWTVDPRAKFRVTLQAALWRRSTLRSQLRRHEDPWQFEVFGSARARRLKYRVFCANRDRFHGSGRAIFPYQPTGIVRGRWQREIVEPLFSAHGIDVDFSRRGFNDPASPSGARRSILSRVSDRMRSLV